MLLNHLYKYINLIILITIQSPKIFCYFKRGEPNSNISFKYFKMPGVAVPNNNIYMCTSITVNMNIEQWVLKFQPLASADRVHHMLLYGCSGLNEDIVEGTAWDCGHHGVCMGGRIMYAWAKNAPSTHLPDNVGFHIGRTTNIKYLTLQIHYAKALPKDVRDDSGLQMTVTSNMQQFKAGIYLLAAGFADIPPLTPKTHVDINCRISDTEPVDINIFAFRVHAHTLGSVISGYKYEPETKLLSEIVKGNPQWPQAFYPLDKILKVRPHDILHTRCTYNSTLRDRHTFIGPTNGDEMCNLYLMYYTDRENGSEFGACGRESFRDLTLQLPASSDEPLPHNSQLEEMTMGENVNKEEEITYNDVLKGNSGEGSAFNKAKEDCSQTVQMPGVTPTENDSYICAVSAVNHTTDEWVVKFEPLVSADRAHHLLLFGCSGISEELLLKGHWECGHHGVCTGGKVMYAWAKNAPATHLPDDVGFHIGGDSEVKFLVLQIHYAKALPPNVKDESGVQLTLMTKKPKYKAGIYLLFGQSGFLPPHVEKSHIDINCMVAASEPDTINIFGFRVHAHKLASVITGYTYNPQTYDLKEIVKGNPHWPQAFYPTENIVTVTPQEIIHARCTYNTTNCETDTYIGSTADDEMCNLYLMYYTDVNKGSAAGGCGDENYPAISDGLLPSSDEPLPPNPLLEEMAHGEHKSEGNEVNYNNLFTKQEPIEVTKKTQSRKDPVHSGFSYYNYPNYEDYAYEQPLSSSSRGWNRKHSPDYPNLQPRFREDGKYQLKPKPVAIYNDREENSDKYGRNNGPNFDPREHLEESIVSSPRESKQLSSDSAFRYVESWKPSNYKLGQVTGVAVDSRGDVVVFHRGERKWDGSTFSRDFTLLDHFKPIPQSTLLHLQKDSGQVMHEWAAHFFYMPHGLTIDSEDNIWLTDVGMHQVFQFPSGFGEGKALLVLGTKFQPGNDNEHFCQPTSVAVMKNGEFFVADGYCNSRIIHFSPMGKLIKQFGESSQKYFGLDGGDPKVGSFSIPHALALVPDHEELCVADRENGRVQCFSTESGKFQRIFKFNEWGNRIFAIAYTPKFGGKLFAVNGPQFIRRNKIQVFEINYMGNKVIASFSPYQQGLSNPHDLALSEDGQELYVVEIGPNKIYKFASAAKTNSNQTSKSPANSSIEVVKTGQLKEAALDGSMLFSNHWSSVGIFSVVIGIFAIPVIVVSILTIIMRCKRKGSSYSDSKKFKSNLNGKGRGGGLSLGSLLNKRRGFEQVATNDIDEDLESADSDVEEFSVTATKV